MISVNHIGFLVKVEFMWVQDPRSSPKSSLKLPTNTVNINYMTRAAITHTKVLQKYNQHDLH